jgi:adenosylhomocysteine nucleosidase
MLDAAVFTALDWERHAVTAALRDVAPAARPRSWQGRTAGGTTWLVVQTGVGPARAASAAASAPPARLFVSAGAGGALADGLAAGDLVAADAIVVLDAAGRETRRIAAAGSVLGAWAAGRGLRIHVGPVASSPAVLATAAAKRAAATTGAVAVEMESAAITAAAASRRVPHADVRAIVDLAGDSLPFPPDVIDADTGALHLPRALRAAAPPWRWRAAIRLARQRRAADDALRAFFATLAAADAFPTLAAALATTTR